MNPSEASSPPSSSPVDPEVRQWARFVAEAALDVKGQELRVLRLSAVSDMADYFVVCTGATDRQVQAIADRVLEKLRSQGVRPLHVEGYQPGTWVLIDFGAIVVHVFQPEPRDYFALERLWADAPDETKSLLESPN